MKLTFTKRLFASLVVALTMSLASFSAYAVGEGSKLVIGDGELIPLNDEGNATVAIYLDNTAPVYSLQFDMQAQGLDIVKVEPNKQLLPANKFAFYYTEATSRVSVMPMPSGSTLPSIAEGNDPLCYVTLAMADNADEDALALTLTNQLLVFDQEGEVYVKPDDVTVAAAIVANIELTTSSPEVYIKDGQKAPVAFGFTNDATIQGIQFEIALPEGVAFVENSIELSADRQTTGTNYTTNVLPNGNVKVLVFSLITNEICAAGEGDFLTFEVEGGAGLAQESEIEIVNFIATVRGYTNHATNESLAIKVIDLAPIEEQERQEQNLAAYEKDVEAWQVLATDYAAAQELVDNDYAGLGDEEESSAIAQAIQALYEQIQAALEACADEGYYQSPITEEALASISVAIGDYIEHAKNEYQRQVSNVEAADADYDAIHALATAWQQAQEYVEENYPEFNDEEQSSAIAQAIQGLYDEVTAALEACAYEGAYVSPVTAEKVENIEAAIAKYISDAESFSGIKSLLNSSIESNSPIYNIGGQRIDNPAKGAINIIIVNGRPTKIFVK